MSAVPDGGSTSRSIDKALSILELLSGAPDGMRMIDISRGLELPKSSTHVTLEALQRRRYVERDPDGHYRLGLKLFETANRMLSQLDVRRVARPCLETLTRRSGLTSHLAALDGREVVYLDRVDGPSFVKFDTYVGKRARLEFTAVGRAIASSFAEDRLATVLPDADPDLKRQLRGFDHQGYSIEDGVEAEGVYCVGAPIHSASGEVCHSISVIGLRRDLDRDGFQALGAEVREAAHRISEGLGYRFAT